MGLLIGQLRLLDIIKTRSDYEYKLQLISSSLHELLSRVSDIMGQMIGKLTDDPERQLLEAKKQDLKLVEDQLTQQKEHIQQGLQALQGEEQMVRQQNQENTQRFYGGGGGR